MNPIYNSFIYIVWFFSTYFVVFLILVLLTHRERLREDKGMLKRKPMVSIISPAYNEAKVIADTVKSLKKITYPNIEFIIVNDGSTDNTSEIIRKNIKGDKRFVFIDRKENWKKPRSLNQGIAKAKGEFVACMDSDSVVEPEVFTKALPFFDNPKVGAVTISVEVREPRTFLQKIIEIEYVIGLSLFLKILSFFDCVNVTPGPFSIYRKKIFDEIGGFDPENITEDLEIAYRIHKAGYKIRNCFQAKVHTLTPSTFKELYIQRKRWYSGAIQTILKHKDITLSTSVGLFGLFVPFTFLLIASGLGVFYYSLYLAAKHLIKSLWYYQYTGFNFFEHLLEFDLDILAVGRISLVGFCAVITGIAMMLIGLRIAEKRFSTRKLGMLGFPFMFFLYQLFWTSAIVTMARRRDINWR